MLLIKDAFMLGHPKRRRFDYVFENYAATYYSLSNQIATWPRTTEEQRALGRAAKGAGTTQPIRRFKLFMRDGIRGLIGEWPLDHVTLWKVGKALANVANRSTGEKAQFVIAHDGREDADRIAARVAAGLNAAGATVLYADRLPTPAVACLTDKLSLSGGIMVTASHSIHTMNGLKLFWKNGKRIPDNIENEIERECETYDRGSYAGQTSKPLEIDPLLRAQYVVHLREPIEALGRPFKVAVDCANGAVSGLVNEVFKKTEVELDVLSDIPNGRNINFRCGSTHLENLGQSERLRRAHFGVAFDGDGDRILFLLPDGHFIDGDQILLSLAIHFRKGDRLKENRVVGTDVSSFALEQALQARGIEFERAPVGDKHVLRLMESQGSVLGGEPSGNIIISDRTPSGDGLVTLTEILLMMADTGKDFTSIFPCLPVFHQVTLEVLVRETLPFESFDRVNRSVDQARVALGSSGRVVVRYSETEPVARITVEAADAEIVRELASRIASTIDAAIGMSHLRRSPPSSRRIGRNRASRQDK